jgi:transcription initiation factor TFIIIB Brf1 subunit/transcription initiation factor TFIIB
MATLRTEEDPITRRARRGFQIIDELATMLQLPDVAIISGKEVYVDYLKRGKDIRGEAKVRAFAGACLYYACKLQQQNGMGRSEREIIVACSLAKTEMTKAMREIMAALHDVSYAPTLFRPFRAADLLVRFVQQLRLPCTSRDAMKLISQARTIEEEVSISCALDGKTPETIAATCLVAALQGLPPISGIGKREVSQRCGVSLTAIEKCHRQISEQH